jgi:hypothetical protein
VALGVWKHLSDVLAGRRFTRFEPEMNDADRRRLTDGWGRGVAAALAWAGDRRQDRTRD